MDYENIELENAVVADNCAEPAQAPAAPNTGKILGLISMILGFTALGTHLLGIGSALSLPASVASLICGFVSKYYTANGAINGQAKAGITCSFIQIGLSVLAMLAAVAFLLLYLVLYFFIIFMALGSAASGMAMYGI